MSVSELFFGFDPQTIARHPECFAPADKDPHSRQRTTPMQVLSLGMSRTGTASMHAALTALGYETYHGFRAFANIRDYELWNPAYETKYLLKPSTACPIVDRTFLDKALGHMNAVTDMPAASFATDLIEAYPDAKVILVQRDEDAWYRSFERVFVDAYDSWLWTIIARLDPGRVGHMEKFLRRSVAQCHFRASSTSEFRSNARNVYREHYTNIRELLEQRDETESRLLEFDLRDGWVPLCSFLGRDIPKDIPFPKVNEDKMIQEKIQIMLINGFRQAARKTATSLGPLIILVVGCWLWLRYWF